MIKSIVIAGALGLLPMGAAFAQDFDGLHGGVQSGWERTDVRDLETSLGTLPIEDEQQSVTGGLFIGYDRRIASRIVIGGEAGFDLSAGDVLNSGAGAGLIGIDPQWSIDLTSRTGYLVDPQTLAYVRGGYTSARVETTVAGGTAQLSDSENRDGWLVGAGIERLLLRHISGRLEYRYSDLGNMDRAFERHRILAGIAYRF